MKILVIHGPNLRLLGKREPSVYGTATLSDINTELKKRAEEKGICLDIFQSDSEGGIVSRIGAAPAEGVDAIIINPAAYTHTSVAVRDALQGCGIPAVEVHLSNIYSREEFRHTSLIAPAVKGQITGFGAESYYLALDAAAGTAGK